MGSKDQQVRGDPSRLSVDPIDYRLDRRFAGRLLKLARPYWIRKGSAGSWLALIALLALGTNYTVFGAVFSYAMRDQTNALIARNAPEFWFQFGLSTLYMVLRYAGSVGSAYVDTRLNLHWRRWLSTYLIDEYLARKTYYEIVGDKQVDNPDQRIQEEVGPFCHVISLLPRQLFFTMLDMSVQAFILMSIAPALFLAVGVFAVFKFFAMLWIYKPTIRQSFDVTVAEADLRYGLLHVRDHAETVAFYRGEYAERVHILTRLDAAIRKNLKRNVYGVWLMISEFGFMTAWTIVPMLFLAPMFMEGRIEYGVIGQGAASAAALLQSLSLLTNFIPVLTDAAPKVIRLAQIQEKFEALGSQRESTAASPRLEFRTGPEVRLSKVTLHTPGGEQVLIRELSLTVGEGQHLVITGRTGVGKSSLLRAMAGLWTRGQGTLVMPPPGEMIFLPQQPYMILADLRSQLSYPSGKGSLGDAELQAILAQVSLPDLAARHGGLDAVKDWGRVLSLGEQQRIAFARVLIARPRYVFLDEATSAVDIETETLLYALLEKAGTTFVSVGHRPSVAGHHVLALRLESGGQWALAELAERPIDPATRTTAA